MNTNNGLDHATAASIAPGPGHISVDSLPDKDLYNLCKLYGSNAKTWLRKFAGLLPEVYKRQLHRKHGCASIHEFAKKLAGMNERTVSKILNLHKRLRNKPNLLKLFESGEQGWSKLEAIAFIATSENEEELAEKVKKLPQGPLREYVKNQKQKLTVNGQAQNNLQIAQVPYTTISFAISPKSRIKLDLIKHQLQKKHKRTLTYDEVIKFWPYENPNWQNSATGKAENPAENPAKNQTPSRHIPMSIQRELLQKYNYLCAYPGCHKPYHEFHHVKRFAEHHEHNGNHIFPLCKTHHTLAHAGLIANENLPPENWHIKEKPQQSDIDKRVMKFKQPAMPSLQRQPTSQLTSPRLYQRQPTSPLTSNCFTSSTKVVFILTTASHLLYLLLQQG